MPDITLDKAYWYTWQPIETAPRDGTFIIIAAPSGYSSVSMRCEIGHYVEDYKQPWRNHSNDAFEDGGYSPTHWLPLPRLPE